MDRTDKLELLSGFDALGLQVTRMEQGGAIVWLGDRQATQEEIEAAKVAYQEHRANPVPREISDRQFAQVLAINGVVTEAEALAWAGRGELPAAIETAVTALPDEEQFAARMLLASANVYERAHPLVSVLGELLGYDSDELDTIWRQGGAL